MAFLPSSEKNKTLDHHFTSLCDAFSISIGHHLCSKIKNTQSFTILTGNYILLCTKSFAYSTHITELCCFRCICKTSLSCLLMKLKRLLIKVIIAGAKRHIFNNLTFSANYGIILM